MSQTFVHLHLHTEYSLVDGVVRVKPLMQAVADRDMPAVALTDQGNLFATVKFYRAAQQAGIKPIIGAEVMLHNDDERGLPYRLLLLCQNRQGYLNLNRLVTRSFTEGQHRGVPQVKKEWLAGHCDGLIALSGGRHGDVGQALLNSDSDLARSLLDDWLELFQDRYYLELVRTGREGEESYLHAAIDLALDKDVPVVATNDVRFIAREDFDAHEARVCIHDGKTLNDTRRQRLYTDQQFLRSAAQMRELFKDIPEAIANTIAIAQRCNLELEFGTYYLPDFPVPAGKSIEDYLREESRAGLEIRLKELQRNREPFSEQKIVNYRDRLELELGVIISMGFPGYFLIVADFIRWAKQNGVPVGPGRGSGAGSIVAYALGITDLDPIEYDLLFERFLNPERVSMPDFDVDFCMEGRDRVIDYVAQRYGREKVSQIITYGTMAAKAVVRDCGRVLGFPYGFVDQIAKLIPFEIGITLDKALEQEEELQRRYSEDDDVRTIIDLARSLEGITRNAGKHAGGVVIAPSDLTDFLPLYCEQGGDGVVSQFDKDDVETIGLVKFDFLGLRTLTILDWALRTINRQREQVGEEPVDLAQIPMADKATFELLKACETTAVFQLESRGMKELIKRLRPDTFEDIIALVALFRPGPLQSGMVDDFIARKHGAKVEYPHPALEPILKPTYGIILYQEQVMQIAQVLAGYTLGSADLLRRAMGKKKPEEMAKQRSIFTEGALRNGVDEKQATYIFDLMEKFAGYGFNKSHSAAYALVSYHTAYLKAHFPAAFMAAVMSSDMDNTSKVVTLIDECRNMKLEVLTPDVNSCEYAFTSQGDVNILYGLGAIKGVGASALESIVDERNRNGLFKDLFDFCRRIDARKVNRRVLEALIKAGALDGLGPHRAAMMQSLSVALKSAEQHIRNESAGVMDMFGGPGEADDEAVQFLDCPEWAEDERLNGEKETLGLYLTGHPITRYLPELEKFITTRLNNVRSSRDRQAQTLAGLVVGLQTRNNKSGDRMAFLTLDDRSGRIDVAVFGDEFKRYQSLISKDRLLVVKGPVSDDEFSGGLRLRAEVIYDIDTARESYARQLLLRVDAGRAGNGFIQSLGEVLSPFRDGQCPVAVEYDRGDATARLVLGENWRVHPADELLHRLRELVGEQAVEIQY